MNDTVTMAHGAGGKQTSELIQKVFRAHFENPYFTADDASVLPAPKGRIAMTTDGFIVSPQFFPGGNIGKLSICGTVNDLSCMGAKPLYMTCAFVIEEGFEMAKLEEIAAAMEKTANEVGVRLVAGDTKVAGKGQCGGVGTVLYEIAAESGVGVCLDQSKIPVDDKVRGVTGMLGLEPLYLACEGRLVMICPQEKADRLVEVLRGQKYTENAVIIGTITKEHAGRVIMTTEIGTQTLLPEPGNELLPRIC